MAQYAQDFKKAQTSAWINLILSILITCAAIVYMFTMDTFLPEVTTQEPWIVYVPALFLIGISMWILIEPQQLEW